MGGQKTSKNLGRQKNRKYNCRLHNKLCTCNAWRWLIDFYHGKNKDCTSLKFRNAKNALIWNSYSVGDFRGSYSCVILLERIWKWILENLFSDLKINDRKHTCERLSSTWVTTLFMIYYTSIHMFKFHVLCDMSVNFCVPLLEEVHIYSYLWKSQVWFMVIHGYLNKFGYWLNQNGN